MINKSSSLVSTLFTVRGPSVVRWGLVVGAALSLFGGAIAPGGVVSPLTSFPVPFGSTALWLHFFGYATFGVVLATAVQYSMSELAFSVSFGAVATYGVAAELLHLALSYRTFSTFDIAANVSGAFVGVTFVWLLVVVFDELLCIHPHRSSS